MHETVTSSNTQALIITIGGVITTLLTVHFKDRIQTSIIRKKPKDRFDLIFDGYERLIKELQDDLQEAREINALQGKKMRKMQERMNLIEEELEKAREHNRELLIRLQKYEGEAT